MWVLRFLLLATALGCSPPARLFEGAQAVENLRVQARGVERAMIQEDHPLMADLTHPALIDAAGGRVGYLKELEKAAAELRGQGLKFHAFRFGTASPLYESAGAVYAVYPYALELTGPHGESASQPGYLVCASSDSGATWRFLDGAGIGTERSRLLRFLPRFPAELTLPQPQPLVVYR